MWDGQAKIKQNFVVKQYCEGRLRIINVTFFISSMKLTWFRRVILFDGPWQSVVNNTINFNKLLVSERCYDNAVQNKIKKNGSMYLEHIQMISDLMVRTLNITFSQVQFSITITSQLATNQHI